MEEEQEDVLERLELALIELVQEQSLNKMIEEQQHILDQIHC
jgi:hypothetical protein